MNILPKNISGFSDTAYWDSFFKSTRGKETFEWYGEYNELSSYLHKYIKPKDHVLIVGCGNSTLSYDLHRNGIQDQISIDISEVVINQMKRLYPHITFSKEDVTNMDFESSRFTAILDKGTFDALTLPLKDKIKTSNGRAGHDVEVESEETDKSTEMLDEIDRVLNLTGRFICVSLLQPFVAKKLFSFFISRGWMTRVYRCREAEARNKEDSTASDGSGCFLPVYVVIFTKFKRIEGAEVRIELAVGEARFLTKMKSVDELLAAISEEQTFACVIRSLGELGTCIKEGYTFTTTTSEGVPRYQLHVVDCLKYLRNSLDKKYALFIVPPGKETEYLFADHTGRQELALQAGYSRLLVVHMERDQVYPQHDEIKNEIMEGIIMCRPRAVQDRTNFNILTVGNENYERKVIARGESKFIGKFVVEDVSIESSTILRRLIFINNPNVIQSEAQLIPVSEEQTTKNNRSHGRKSKRHIGNPVLRQSKTLSCVHHGVFSISFGMLKYFFKMEIDLTCLILGLGGGLLAKFIRDFMPTVNLTAVEIDEQIANIAKEYFCLPDTSDHFRVVIDDALAFIRSTDVTKYNVILIDVSSDSSAIGLQCPPAVFLDEDILQCYKNKLTADGILSINICCRNLTIKQELIEKLYKFFPFIYQYQCTEDINLVIFCFLKVPSANPKSYSSLLEKSMIYMTEVSKSNKNIKTEAIEVNEEPRLIAMLENFSLLKDGRSQQNYDASVRIPGEQLLP